MQLSHSIRSLVVSFVSVVAMTGAAFAGSAQAAEGAHAGIGSGVLEAVVKVSGKVECANLSVQQDRLRNLDDHINFFRRLETVRSIA